MARVITPSGDEVRTVYSSAGFAAGDYVFQTANGFEKAQGSTPWPLKSGSAWGTSQSPIPLGFGYSSASDLLLGPSQTGGTYTGSAITAGDTRFANISTTVAGGNYFEVTRLSSGNFLVVNNTGSSCTVQVFDPTFTTTYASFTGFNGGTSINQFRCYPDNSGGCIINFCYAGTNQAFMYVANTTGNTYGLSNIYTAGFYNDRWYYSNCVLIVQDGFFYYAGALTGAGSYYLQMNKYSYTPRSTSNISQVVTANNGGAAPVGIFYTNLVLTRTSFGSSLPYLHVIASNGATNFIMYDTNPATSFATPSIANGASGWGPAAIWSIGNPTYIKASNSPNYGAAVIPFMVNSGQNIQPYVLPVDSYGFLTTSGAFLSTSFNVSSSDMTTTTAGLQFGITTTSSVTASNYPDLAIYYAKYTTGPYSLPCMRTITGDLSSSPTLGAEFSLNSSTPTVGSNNPLAKFDPFSGLIYGTGKAATSTIQGLAAGSLSTPQPFAYGTSLVPSQTGTCVGVALTAASAGGTAKILVRGTAEVRSTLPNMPGALSFNHANYGTPGGIRGSVAGRTVTFEGIDG